MSAEHSPVRLLYSVRETREQLGGISHAYFYKLVNQGLIRLIKLGRRSFVSRQELEAFVAARNHAA